MYPALFVELINRGWSDEDLKKLAGLNILRVFKDAEMVKNLLNLYIKSKFYLSLAGLNILRVFKDAEKVNNLLKSVYNIIYFYI